MSEPAGVVREPRVSRMEAAGVELDTVAEGWSGFWDSDPRTLTQTGLRGAQRSHGMIRLNIR